MISILLSLVSRFEDKRMTMTDFSGCEFFTKTVEAADLEQFNPNKTKHASCEE
jgi:hypothetical protein